MSSTYLCPCHPHSLGFPSLCPVSVLSWRQMVKSHEQADSRVTDTSPHPFLSPLKAHVPHPYSQPLPWNLLATVVATMQVWVLESQPQ